MVRPFTNTALNTGGQLVATFHIIRSLPIVTIVNVLVGGILAFILVELGLFESGLAVQIARFMLSFNWFLILGAFMLVGWLATRTAQTSASLGMQYFSYGAYIVAEALIFVPLLYIANAKAPGPSTAPP